MSWPITVPLLFDATLLQYYQARLAQSTSDWYRGHEMAKMPEDLRVYQHLIESSCPEVIIEFGSHRGGSAVWFADQLDTFCGGGRVVTVDLHSIDLEDPRVTVLTGGLQDPGIIAAVHAIAAGKRVLISEDSAHIYATTNSALREYADLVGPSGWFVIEDTVVDNPDYNVWANGGGVVEAIEEFLASEAGFRFTRNDLNVYGVSSNTGGYLQAWR